MKKIIVIFLSIMLFSCGTKKVVISNQLYEIISQQNDGGAKIKFYETLSESKEIQMLLNDKSLKGKVNATDIETCNYVILNMGEKPTGKYKTEVEKIEETPTKIIIRIKESEIEKSPNPEYEFSNPFAILKIYSKKEIVFE
jgi:PrcB C-terminal